MFKNITLVVCILLLAGCSQLEPQCPALVSEYTSPYEKHTDLANQYKAAKRTYEEKLQEQVNLLEDYNKSSWKYGRTGLDVSSHTKANINYYKTLIDKANQQIKYHELAGGLK